MMANRKTESPKPQKGVSLPRLAGTAPSSQLQSLKT